MPVEPSDLVVVLGPTGSDQVDVGTSAEILAHVTAHVAAHVTDADALMGPVHPMAHGVDPGGQGPDRSAEPDQHVLRFYRAEDGELLRLVLLSDWWTFSFEASGESIGARALEAKVHEVLIDSATEIQELAQKNHEPVPTFPTSGTWDVQLDALRSRLNDDNPPDVHHNDRRDWVHNFFVHGWL